MVNYCSAYNCTNSSDVQKELIFHKFPLNDKERLKKWIHAVRRKNFKPSSNSLLCSSHFIESDYNRAVVSGKLVLKKCAVPTVFEFPENLISKVKDRRILKRSVEIQDTVEDLMKASPSDGVDFKTKTFVDVGVQTKLSGDDINNAMNNLRREKKILQQKLNRRDKRLIKDIEQLEELKNAKENERQTLETQNQKLRYRLKFLKEAAATATETKIEPCDTKENSLINLHAILINLFSNAIKTAYPSLEDFGPPAVSAGSKFADYQCNASMQICKLLKAKGENVSPNAVAKKVVECLEQCDIIEKVDVSGPGFINIWLSRNKLQKILKFVLENKLKPEPLTNKQRIVVDFSSPNVAKEMHVGHLRSTIIGDSLCRVFEFIGHDVLRLNHIGDWGTQFGMLIALLQDKFPDYKTVSPPINDLQQFYKQSKVLFDNDPEFKKRAYECVVKLQSMSPDHVQAWKLICDVSRQEFQKIYERLNISIIERGESFYQSRMESLVKELEDKGFLENDEGRKIMWSPESSIPLTIVKSDGGFTYDTSDFAALKQRIEEEKADRIIYVTDAGQSTHFETIKKCAIRAGILDSSKVRMDFVGFGVVLGEDKKKFKTRSGDTVRLVGLLDEGIKRARDKLVEKGRDIILSDEELKLAETAVAYGCIKYADLCHNRSHEYVFSFDKMLEDKGNTAVYLLYALTRIRSIFNNLGTLKQDLNEPISLDHEKEWKLAKTLLRFSEVLSKITEDFCLHHLCEYLYDVATAFSEFYDNCYCIEKNAQTGEIIKVFTGRILLCQITAEYMNTGLNLLGINTVSRM